MIVIVDTNESTDRAKNRADRSSLPDQSNIRVVKRLKQRFPGVQTGSLTSGDINVILDDGKIIAFERKRAGDFLNSIKDGHLKRQVQRMSENADWSAVIIEGAITFNQDDMAVIPIFDKHDNIKEMETTGWRGEAVRSVIYAIMFNGTPVVAIQYPQQLPDIVESLIRFCSKPTEHMQGLPRRRLVTFPPLTVQEDIFAQFPGIGTKRMKSMIEFTYRQNGELNGTQHNNTPVLAEMLCWGSNMIRIHPSHRPEGWGNATCLNFRTALGLSNGHYLTIEVDEEQIKEQKKYQSKQQAKQKERSKVNGKRTRAKA